MVLPINYDALYEVHLFALIPLLLATLVVLWKPGPWGRGMALALLLIATFLLRNENIIAVVLFALVCISYEVRTTKNTWRALSAGYAIPILGAFLVLVFFYVRRDGFALVESFQVKQTSSVCVSVAYTYIQRVGDFQGSPFQDCEQVVQRLFGVPNASIVTALRVNPVAMLAHLWWNFRLIPAGLQVLLFNYRSGPINPDYVETNRSSLIILPSLALFLTFCAALFLLRRHWKDWRTEWFDRQMWGWIMMGVLSVTVLVVALINRPRPSYMFLLGIVVRAAVALSVLIVLRQCIFLRKPLIALSAALVLAVLLLPNVYQARPSARPVLRDYRRLKPFGAKLYRPGIHLPGMALVAASWPWELISFDAQCMCDAIYYEELRRDATSARLLSEALDRRHATDFFANEVVLSDPVGADFAAHAEEYGWRVLGRGDASGDRWALWERSPSR